MRREPSRAEQQLSRAVSARVGVPITARQIERWRDAGYVRPLERARPGRGNGSSSWVTPRLVDEVGAFASALHARKRRRLDEAALAVFAECGPIGEQAVRRAYQSQLDRLERSIRALSTTPESSASAWEAAPRIVAAFLRTGDGRRWRARLDGRAERPEQILERMFAGIVMALLGDSAPPEQSIEDFLDASGLAAATRERVGPLGPLVERISIARVQEMLIHFNLPALQERIDRTPFTELERARGEARELAAFLNEVAPTLKETTGLQEAFGIGEAAYVDLDESVPLLAVGMLVFEEMRLPVARLVELSRRWLPVYAGIRRVASTLPRAYRRYLGPDGVSELNRRPLAVRKSFLAHLRQAVRDHPQDAAAITRPPST